MSQPPFPVPPQQVGSSGAQRITPSGRWFALGGALIALGVIGGVLLGLVGFVRTSGRIDDFQRVGVPGSGVVNLTESGGYTVYFEYPGASSGSSIGPSDGTPGMVDLRIADPSGAHVELERYSSGVTYSFGEHEGRAGFSFQVQRPGAYRVTTAGDSNVTVAIGQGLGSSFVGTLLGAAGLGIGGVLLGALVIAVVAIKRSGSRRRAVAGSGRYPPPGRPTEY